MDKKVTKKMLQDLISEEIENLSEEETDEVVEGIGDRISAWRAGRKRKKDVEQWEAFKGNLGHKLNQLAKSHQAGFKSITDDITSGGEEFVRFAARFEPWTKAVEGIGLQIQGLENASKAVLRTPVEVSPDETPGGDEEEAAPEPTRREQPDAEPSLPDVTDLQQTDEEGNLVQQESRRRTIKKAQKLLKENKKIKVVKSNGRKK
jgi:hypothetical protein